MARKRLPRLLLGIWFCCAEWLGLVALAAATLSDPQVDAYNCRMSTILIGGQYQFTTNSSLLEGALVLTNLGVNSYKFTMGSSPGYGLVIPATISNLMQEARDESTYRAVFDLPTLKHYVIWCYTFPKPNWKNGLSGAEATAEYNEIYALSRYLLTNYNNSGKRFYLGHWEGDWSTGLSTSNTVNSNPSATALQGMIDWLNTRQKAVDDAMAAAPHTNVYVYNYTEVNRVVDSTTTNSSYTNRVINCVVPYVTNLDYVSWSSYDIQNKTNVAWWLDYANSFIPTNKAAQIPGRRLFIGEFGWGGLAEAQQAPLIQAYDHTLFAWGCPFSFYWELYDNETNADGSLAHFDLIDSRGTKTATYWLYAYYWNAVRLELLAFKQSQGRVPTDAEFNALAAAMLQTNLPAPIALTVTAEPPEQITPTSARLKGTLAQGIYGDSAAVVTLCWGPTDGGTNRSAWANAISMGTNTLAGTVPYGLLVTNLPLGNYSYRYCAANASGEVWSAVSAQIRELKPQDYGCSLPITFGGYQRSETLPNFPVLVCLSSNLPGFSYAQFASPSGGDLRFTDANGLFVLPHEIDEWNTNGTSYVWVQMPALSGPTSAIWAYWGNAAATNPPASTTNGAVWSNGYDLVWHLKESGFPYLDSAQQFPATSGFAPALATGAVGKGARFSGSAPYLSPGPLDLGGAFTVSAWINVTNTASSIQTVWANKASGTNIGFAFYVNTFASTDRCLIFESADGTSLAKAKTDTNAVSYGEWHLVSAAVNSAQNTVKLYVDGVEQTLADNLRPGFVTQAPVNLGRFATNSASGYYFKGLLDEARLESAVRSSNWIWASYLTVASNAAFASCGSVLRNRPLLSLAAAGANGGGRLVLNWPGNDLTFSLYSATNLNATTTWYPVTNAPVLITSNHLFQNQVTFPITNDRRRFFRLKAP